MKCLNCDSTIPKRNNKYCDNFCQKEYQGKQYIARWLKGLEDGSVVHGCSQNVRTYLYSKHMGCQICGWDKVNQSTNRIPLEIHHIDGDYKNNSPENIQILCPNCHSITDNYKNLNNGNGRVYRNKQAGVTQR